MVVLFLPRIFDDAPVAHLKPPSWCPAEGTVLVDPGGGQWAGQGSGPVLWTFTGRKTLPPVTSLPVMDKIAGANTASLIGYLHSTKTRARWAEGFHELNGYVFDLERDGLSQVVLCPRLTMR